MSELEVNLVAYTRLNPDLKLELGAGISEPEVIATSAMRYCNVTDKFENIVLGSKRREVKNRIRSAIKLKHTMVPEMVDFTFEIRGLSRASSHQLVRHRTAAFLQQSQRTVDQMEINGRVPQTIMDNDEALKIAFDIWVHTTQGYKQLVDLGIPKEDARYMLVNAKYTSLIMKIDGNNLIHFLRLRMLDPHAQWEIKELATKMYELVKEVAPNLVAEDLQDYWW